VAYVPVGVRFNKKLIEPKDFKGVMSSGMILAKRELDIEEAPEESTVCAHAVPMCQCVPASS